MRRPISRDDPSFLLVHKIVYSETYPTILLLDFSNKDKSVKSAKKQFDQLSYFLHWERYREATYITRKRKASPIQKGIAHRGTRKIRRDIKKTKLTKKFSNFENLLLEFFSDDPPLNLFHRKGHLITCWTKKKSSKSIRKHPRYQRKYKLRNFVYKSWDWKI